MTTSMERLLLEMRLKYAQRSRIRRKRSGGVVKPKPIAPRSEALRYVGLVQQYQTGVNDLVLPEIKRLINALFAIRQDDAQTDDTERTFNDLADDVLKYISSGLFETSVAAVGFDVLAFSDRKYDRGVYKVIGFNNISISQGSDMVNSWLKENLQLIRGINTAQMSSLQTLFLRATRDGINKDVLISSVQKILDSGVRRATLVASDQVYKLSGQLDRLKQQSVGITHYIWRTMADSRVRPSHRALNGQRRSWEDDSLHPGQDIACRCHPEPDIDSLFDNNK